MYKLPHKITHIPSVYKFVFGYDVWSGRKTACTYLYNKHKVGLILDNTVPHQVPVYDYNFKTMLEDMHKILPKTNIYIAGVQDEEQFALFRQFGFVMVKIDRTTSIKNRTTKWNFLRQDMLDFVSNDRWDVIIENNDSLDDFYQEIETKIINNTI